MTHVRRPSLLTAGEPLLLARSTIETAVRFRSFIEESGLPTEAVLSSTLCASPLPVYTDFGTYDDGRPRRRWASTRPEFMWHPLMWLPRRVAGRYQINDPITGQSRMEDDDLWAIRMAFEVTASGLYDPESGTWADILSTVGLNVEDDLDLARVQDWLDGYSDDLLDDLDLSAYMDIEPTEWALESALAMRTDLEHASWALVADDLLDMVEEAIEPANRLTATDMRMALRSLAGLGESLLAKVPTTTEDGASTGAESESHLDFFVRVHDQIDLDAGTPENFIVIDHLAQARERLFAIREVCWPRLEALGNIEGQGTADSRVGV